MPQDRPFISLLEDSTVSHPKGYKGLWSRCRACSMVLARSTREVLRHKSSGACTGCTAEEREAFTKIKRQGVVEHEEGKDFEELSTDGKRSMRRVRVEQMKREAEEERMSILENHEKVIEKESYAHENESEPLKDKNKLSARFRLIDFNLYFEKEYIQKEGTFKKFSRCKVCSMEMIRSTNRLMSHKTSGQCKGASKEELAYFKDLLRRQARGEGEFATKAKEDKEDGVGEKENLEPGGSSQPVRIEKIKSKKEDSVLSEAERVEPSLYIEETCKACNGQSSNADHVNWNGRWLACVECGDAYHLACAFTKSNSIFSVEPLFAPSNPLELSSDSSWKCSNCLDCPKCEGAKSDTVVRSMCRQCRRVSCSACSTSKKQSRPLWKGQWHVCNRCIPSCLSCGKRLGENRAAESRWCRECQLDLIHGRSCPVCSKTYGDDNNGDEDEDDGDNDEPEDPMIQCDGCSVWVHFPCTGLALHDLKRLTKSSRSSYQCPRCKPFTPPHIPQELSRGVIRLRAWSFDEKSSASVKRCTWSMTKRESSFFIWCGANLFSAKSLDEVLGLLEGHLVLMNSSASRRIVHFFRQKGLALFKEEKVKPAVKRIKTAKSLDKTSASPSPIVVVEVPAPVVDDGLCARIRPYPPPDPPAPVIQRTRSFEADESLPDTFSALFVPAWSDKSMQYRTVTLSQAYRLLGNPIQKGALEVKRSGIAGYGLFAGRRYVRNELIIEYQGEVIGQALADLREAKDPRYRHSCYMFRLDATRIIDATIIGNAGRFINHSCQPNCRTKPLQVDGQMRIFIVAAKDIRAGEELSYDYQFALDAEDGKGRLPCYCGSRKCRGWMN